MGLPTSDVHLFSSSTMYSACLLSKFSGRQKCPRDGKARVNPISPLSAFKQVLSAAGLSTVLMIMALYASKPSSITEFDGWTLRPSIPPSVQRGPEVPSDFLHEITIDVSQAFARAAD